jgi:hypothetical protein
MWGLAAYTGDTYAANASWTRIGTYFPSASGYSLFKGNLQASINPDDVIQGYLGDCWVLSAISTVAAKSARVWNMFD